ncbi:LON peptidase N-terminal domain and RING finger protein 3-like [Lampetra fluviatilis]
MPVFVCAVAFPAVPCPLHVFEPRYRLMVRRCLQTGTRQFGMCTADGHRGFSEHGCMLHIRRVEHFADGRLAVDTVGGRRFRVESRGERDGYSTANIVHLEDERVAGADLQELLHLQQAVYDQAAAWLASLPPLPRAQILRHFGPMPPMDPDPQTGPDGPAWCWWLLAALPLDEGERLSALAATSLHRRLLAARRALGHQAVAQGQPS